MGSCYTDRKRLMQGGHIAKRLISLLCERTRTALHNLPIYDGT